MPARQVLAERFWKYVREGPDCWEWQGARLSAGYGRCSTSRPDRAQTTAHRLAWTLSYGAIPDGLYVLHRCDNPPCVRPEHLFLGTAADNAADMIAKGRRTWQGMAGEAHPRHRLTVEQVRAIRANPDGLTGVALAHQFGVTKNNIYAIRQRRTWRHLAEED